MLQGLPLEGNVRPSTNLQLSRLTAASAGCTNETYEECVNGLIFGLPRGHWCYVQYIKVGYGLFCRHAVPSTCAMGTHNAHSCHCRRMPIFLFNYSTRDLHGIYRAVTDGTWKLNPAGGHAFCECVHRHSRLCACCNESTAEVIRCHAKQHVVLEFQCCECRPG